MKKKMVVPAGPDSKIRGQTEERSMVYFANLIRIKCMYVEVIKTFFVVSL